MRQRFPLVAAAILAVVVTATGCTGSKSPSDSSDSNKAPTSDNSKPSGGTSANSNPAPASSGGTGSSGTGSSGTASSGTGSTVSDSGRFVSQEFGFSIQLPSGWERMDNAYGTIVMALSPVESGADTFRENMNVVQEPLPQAMTVEQYADANLVNLPQAVQSFEVQQQNKVTIGGKPAVLVMYTHVLNQVKMQNLAYFLVSDKRGYVITCSATPDSLAQYRAAFEQAATSFRFQ